MKVAIIGAGNVGKALGSSLSKAGNQVIFASHGDSARAAAEALGGTASAAAPRDAVAKSDIVILAVPYTATREVAGEIDGVIGGKVVIDVTNPLSPDGSGLATERGTSGAENIGRWLPGAAMVKAFNTIFASVQGNPNAHDEQLDALFATDDENARETVAALIIAIGFRPVWVGGLSHARELEAMAFLNISLQIATGGYWNTAYKMVGVPAAALEHRVASRVGARK